jgi:hypothetical protein
VLRVDQDNLKVLVCGVLVDPVRVQDSQIRTPTSHTLLSRGLQRALVFELVYALIGRFSCEDNSSITVPT